MKKVYMANDKATLNSLYRKNLSKILQEKNYKVIDIGLFKNNGYPNFKSIIKLLFSVKTPVISSNLRTNVLLLLMPWIKGLVILNGLGRNRGNKKMRKLIISLLLVNKKKSITIQSYADYRYFRKYCSEANIFWVPGSGGKKKIIGNKERAICIQRDDKISAVAKSINSIHPIFKEITVVGCNNRKNLESKLNKLKINSVGRVPSDKIFQDGKIFIQPSGYGEGFPHTLADAICSEMNIYIDNTEYIRYGLFRIGSKRKIINKNWSKLITSEETREIISEKEISKISYENLKKACN